jgi:hypothetical protein
MRLAGPERELVKKRRSGLWRVRAISLSKFPSSRNWKLLEGVFRRVLRLS